MGTVAQLAEDDSNGLYRRDTSDELTTECLTVAGAKPASLHKLRKKENTMSKEQIQGMKDGIEDEANSCNYDLVEFKPVSPDGKTLIEVTLKLNYEWEDLQGSEPE